MNKKAKLEEYKEHRQVKDGAGKARLKKATELKALANESKQEFFSNGKG